MNIYATVLESFQRFLTDHDNTLVINPMIYAECSVGFERIEEVEDLFEHLVFAMHPLPRESLFRVGGLSAMLEA